MKKQLLPFILFIFLCACEKETPNAVGSDSQNLKTNTGDYSSNNSNTKNPVSTTHGILVVKNSNANCFAIVPKNAKNIVHVAAGETLEKSYPIGTYTYSVICGFNAGMSGCCSFSGLLKNDKTFEIKANEKTFIGGSCH